MKKRLMILGAGLFMVTAVKKAVKLGYEVFTVDYYPNNIAHRYSHDFLNCSTVDKDGILRLARDLHIDGIFSMASDVAVPTVAYVAEKLKLCGPTIKVASVMTNKQEFRKFQKESKLPHPVFNEETDIITLRQQVAAGKKYIIKPVDSSGSKGIYLIDKKKIQQFDTILTDSKYYSLSDRVYFEQFLDGDDITAEGYLFNGKIVFVQFTQKFKKKFAVTGHILPCHISEQQKALCIKSLKNHFAALNYREGPFDADLIVDTKEAYVIEISPRLGGNGVPQAVSLYSGVDLIEAALLGAMGRKPSFPKNTRSVNGCGSVILSSEKEGHIVSIGSREEIMQQIPEVIEMQLFVWPGRFVEPLVHGGHALGYAIFHTNSPDEYYKTTIKINHLLDIKIINQQTQEDFFLKLPS